MSDLTLTQEQYESLVKFARAGAADDAQTRELEAWFKIIEEQNGITRSLVVVRWQELDEPQPTGYTFPGDWPPNHQYTIEMLSRAVAKADVESMLAARATSPTNVMCTRDPAGELGWTLLDDFFVT